VSESEARRRADLEEVWTTVLLEVEHPTEVRTPAHVAGDHGATVHVITAWNPASSVVDPGDNRIADDELRGLLVEAAVVHERCTGSNPDGSWREEGWAVVGLSRAEAIELGRRFGQDAIYEVTSDLLHIVWCDTGQAVPVASDAG
jgi:hypothetical protein